jgi:hypothetical protein
MGFSEEEGEEEEGGYRYIISHAKGSSMRHTSATRAWNLGNTLKRRVISFVAVSLNTKIAK